MRIDVIGTSALVELDLDLLDLWENLGSIQLGLVPTLGSATQVLLDSVLLIFIFFIISSRGWQLVVPDKSEMNIQLVETRVMGKYL